MNTERYNKVSIGVITDIHYSESEGIGNRCYRDSLSKVRQAVETFNHEKPSFCINLGDLIDNDQTLDDEISNLKAVEREYAKFNGERHYVLGNHDLAGFSKEQFFGICLTKGRYYSFDCVGFHFIILDACYNEDESEYNKGNFDWIETYMPIAEQEWLESDLKNTDKRTFIFIHQRLDDENDVHGVKNGFGVRKIIEKSGKVFVVFQGHDHRGGYAFVDGIHYFTFRAIVEGSGLENNAYSLIHIDEESVYIEGFGNQISAELTDF